MRISFRFSGSRAERQAGDILADYFGLPVDFSSTVNFSPHISNTIIDFDWFQAFDAYLPGLIYYGAYAGCSDKVESVYV